TLLEAQPPALRTPAPRRPTAPPLRRARLTPAIRSLTRFQQAKGNPASCGVFSCTKTSSPSSLHALHRDRSRNFGIRGGASLAKSSDFISNQPRSAIICEVRPCPLDHHQDPVAESDQEQDVNEEPRQPGRVAGHLELGELRHGRCASNRCQAAPIVVVERLSWLTLQVGDNAF